MRKRFWAILGMVACLAVSVAEAGQGAPGKATVTRADQKDMSITIYNGNLGLVKDVRELPLGPGGSEVMFMDVASQIDPTTVHLKSLTDPTGLRILEQNYEYDLLNPQKLLDKFVGKTVKLMTSDGTRSTATKWSSSPTSCPVHLARLCAIEFEKQRNANTIGMVLMNHGIFSFADDAKTSYER